MESVIFCALILFATPALGRIPNSDNPLGSFLPDKYQYNPRYGVGQFLESLTDMGYKDDMIQLFNKTPKHEFGLKYQRDGPGKGKIQLTRVLGNIVRVSKDFYLEQEFVEILYDDRKSKTTLIYEEDWKIAFNQVIEGGLNVTTRYVSGVAEGVITVTTEVTGKSPKSYLLANF